MRDLSPKQRLSKRELEVSRLVAQGLTNKEIARTLFISQRTAEGHVAQICNKLGFSTRAQIAAWAATVDAQAAVPAVAPTNGRESSTTVHERPLRLGAGARWLGVAIIVIGLVGAALAAMHFAPQTPARPEANVILSGLNRPSGIAVDSTGAVLILNGNRVERIVGAGTALVAGTGTNGFSGDGGSAKLAELNLDVYPGTSAQGLAVDRLDNVYIADSGNHRIRKVSGATISTIAGSDSSGGSGDEGLAIKAQLSSPRGLAIDTGGNLYIADIGTNRVRMIDPQGIIHAVAGNGGTGDGGDGGPAVMAQLNGPTGVAIDQATGNLYIADSANNRVRKVTPDGKISTVAGTGAVGAGGDGGDAKKATLRVPTAVATDDLGDVFVADTGNNRVRRIDANGTITTIALAFALNHPLGVVVNTSGQVLIADTYHDRVVKLRP